MDNSRLKTFSPLLAGRIEEFYSDLQAPSPSSKQQLRFNLVPCLLFWIVNVEYR